MRNFQLETGCRPICIVIQYFNFATASRICYGPFCGPGSAVGVCGYVCECDFMISVGRNDR